MDKSCNVPLTGCDVVTVTGCRELAQRYDVLATSFYFCSLCTTDLSPDDFRLKGKRCLHPPTSCDACVLRHLQACAPMLPFKSAPCPHAGCKEEISARDLRRMAMKLTRSMTNGNNNNSTRNVGYLVECLHALLRRPRCTACNEEKDEEFALRKATKKCTHGKVTCRLCLTKHIRHCIYGKQTTEIPCLVQGCGMMLTVADVAVHTDARTSMSLQKLLLAKRMDEQARRKKALQLEAEREQEEEERRKKKEREGEEEEEEEEEGSVRPSPLANRTKTRICDTRRGAAVASSSSWSSNSNDSGTKQLNMSILTYNDSINSSAFDEHRHDTHNHSRSHSDEYDDDDTDGDILACVGRRGQQGLLVAAVTKTNLVDKASTVLQRPRRERLCVFDNGDVYEDNKYSRNNDEEDGREVMMMKMLMMPSSPLSPLSGLSSHDASASASCSCSGGSGGDGDGEGDGEGDGDGDGMEWSGTRWTGTEI